MESKFKSYVETQIWISLGPETDIRVLCLFWEDKHENPTVVNKMAGLFLYDFVNARPLITSFPLLSPSRWTPHPSNWIKINVDASFYANTKCRGIGVVFRDEAGSYARGFICKIPHVTDPYTTEILTACEGLHLVIQRHRQHVILENDALQVVQAIRSPSC